MSGSAALSYFYYMQHKQAIIPSSTRYLQVNYNNNNAKVNAFGVFFYINTLFILTKFAKSNKMTKHIIPTDSSSCLTTRQVSVGKGVKAYGKSKGYDQNKSHD
jgi:hypothetical protein